MTLRVGISGFGLAGRYFHAPLLVSTGFELVGAVTKNEERIAHLREDYPGAKAVSTIDDLLELGLDLLVVASANTAHASDAIAGVRAGVPVVVDKPMGRTLAETQEIVDISTVTGVPVTTYFNRLWDSDALTIKKILADGVIGKAFRLESRFERFRPEPNPTAWRERSSSLDGGGNLLDLQPHLISTALDWFGPAELTYASVRSIRGYADDDVVLTLKHESGVDSYLAASAIIGAPGPRIRLSGDEGSLIINDLDPQESFLRAGKRPVDGRWSEDTRSGAKIYRGDEIIECESVPGNYALFYHHVREAILGKGDWPVSTSSAIAVATIIDQARALTIR